MIRAAVSGSFHRHMAQIYRAVGTLADAGAEVLSPADPRIVDAIGEFDFVASDRLRSVRLTQDRHLQSIRASDFLWVVSPDGYVGSSVAMEIGAAACWGVPIFSADRIADPAMAANVRVVGGIAEAMGMARQRGPRATGPQGILIAPGATVEKLHGILDRFGARLVGASDRGRRGQDDPAAAAAEWLRGSF